MNSSAILTAANEIVKLGLKDLGYEYVNSKYSVYVRTNIGDHLLIKLVDDCWSVRGKRDSTTQRIIPDTNKFPDGISGLASQVHGMGLKIGIYSSKLTNCPPSSYIQRQIETKCKYRRGSDHLCGISS